MVLFVKNRLMVDVSAIDNGTPKASMRAAAIGAACKATTADVAVNNVAVELLKPVLLSVLIIRQQTALIPIKSETYSIVSAQCARSNARAAGH